MDGRLSEGEAAVAALRGGIHAVSSFDFTVLATVCDGSPLRRRTGNCAIHSSMSVESHMLLPPTMRERGNYPALIHAHRVGYEQLAIAITSCLSSRRTAGFGFVVMVVLRDFPSSWTLTISIAASCAEGARACTSSSCHRSQYTWGCHARRLAARCSSATLLRGQRKGST